MLVVGSGVQRTGTARFQEIEQRAYQFLESHEEKEGVRGCVVKTELLLPAIGCELVYFSDEERAEHRIPVDAIGALKPDQKLVFIYSGIKDEGRENQTIGEEIGHLVLHSGKFTPGQDSSGEPMFCRMLETSYLNGTIEPIWMSREASFFAACLQMPRERYGPVVAKELRTALHMRPPSFGHGEPLARKIDKLCTAVRKIDGKPSPEQILDGTWKIFDTLLINEALNEMERKHDGMATMMAQKRRLAELGFTHDAADIFAEHLGIKGIPPFQHYFLADCVRRMTL